VVSGINHGGNLGDDITYSGTVAAAMEANLMGIPAIAVSLATYGPSDHFPDAARVALQVATELTRNRLPEDTFLNVNVPNLPFDQIKPVRITRQGKRSFVGKIIDKVDPRGRKYFWIGSEEPSFLDDEDTDFHAVGLGHVSVTPLHLDLTNYRSMQPLQSWRFGTP